MRPQFARLQRKAVQKGFDHDLPDPAVIEDFLRNRKPQPDRRIQPSVHDEVNEETWRRYEQWKKEQDRKPSEEGPRGVEIMQL